MEKIPGAFLAFHWFLIVAGDLNQSERYKEKIVGIQGKKRSRGKGELRGSGECRRRGKLLVRG